MEGGVRANEDVHNVAHTTAARLTNLRGTYTVSRGIDPDLRDARRGCEQPQGQYPSGHKSGLQASAGFPHHRSGYTARHVRSWLIIIPALIDFASQKAIRSAPRPAASKLIKRRMELRKTICASGRLKNRPVSPSRPMVCMSMASLSESICRRGCQAATR